MERSKIGSSIENDERESPGGLVAVLIGIDGYDIKSLHCTVNDAVYLEETLTKIWRGHKALIKTLIWPSFNSKKAKLQQDVWGIELPENAEHVTRKGIISTIEKWSSLASEEDLFLIFYAGHGVLIDKEPAIVSIRDGIRAGGMDLIKIKEIQEAAKDCCAKQKVMILDCCQNAMSRYEDASYYADLEGIIKDWSLLISSSPGEYSLEDEYFGDTRDDYLQQGVFTAHFVVGLRGEASGDGKTVNLAELAYYVGKRVPIEYQERQTSIYQRKRQKISGQDITRDQNPVLLCNAISMGGPYQIILAPRVIQTTHDSRRAIPGKSFFSKWMSYLAGKWPIKFPYRWSYNLGGLFYSLAMALTLLWHNSSDMDSNIPMFAAMVSLGSAMIWLITTPFTVAANEERWHAGGYVAGLFYLAWHLFIAIFFFIYWKDTSLINGSPSEFIYLCIDLFFLTAAVLIFGNNAGQTIIALAETIRGDERGEIRQAIQAFLQFKYKPLGVDLYNSIATVSVRPDLYFLFWLIVMGVCIFNIYQVMIEAKLEGLRSIIFISRNVFAMFMVSWMVFWYHAAFKFLQKEIYKR